MRNGGPLRSRETEQSGEETVARAAFREGSGYFFASGDSGRETVSLSALAAGEPQDLRRSTLNAFVSRPHAALMTSLRRSVSIAALLLSAFSVTAEGQALSRGGGFAALVNGKPITFYELEQSVDRRLLAVRGKYPPEVIEQQRPATRQLVLDELITERLLLDRCNRLKITVRPEEIELWVQSEIDRFRAQGDGSIGDVTDFFDQWKANFGENEEQARRTIRNRIRIRRLLDSVYTCIEQDGHWKLSVAMRCQPGWRAQGRETQVQDPEHEIE